jgi:flagellar FliJ protein
MQRFQFRLESVLAVRERAEREAQQALAEQLALEGRCAADAADALRRVREAQSGTAPQAGVLLDALQLRAQQAYRERLERDGRTAARILAAQRQEVAAERARVELASRDREVLKRLKARHAEAHRRAALRAEDDLLGEIALAGHRRRAAEAAA